jgi:hypothetical protein
LRKGGIKLVFKERKYQYDVTTLKAYGDNKYKLTKHKCLMTKGLDFDECKYKSEKGSVNDEKIDVNITRAKSKIYELAMCNEWQYFCTFTIDKTKFDRFNLDKYHRTLSLMIKDYNHKHGTNIKYLIIPEKHKDGAWHEHGLIMGLPPEHLELFQLNKKLPHYIRDKLKAGDKIYYWSAYAEKFGFCDIEPIKNMEAVSGYVTKYITKSLSNSVKKINAHLYYCSQGLKKAVEMKRGTMSANIVPSYENEYVQVKWINNSDEAKKYEELIFGDIDYTIMALNYQYETK